MSARKCKLTKYEIIRLSEKKNMSQKEIAEIAGVSHQRICEILKTNNARKNSVNIEKIRFRGFYEFMRDNPRETYTTLAKAMYGRSVTNDKCSTLRLALTNVTSGDKIRLTVGQIKRLEKYTRKPFAELFELRDHWEV